MQLSLSILAALISHLVNRAYQQHYRKTQIR
jgi:hypothetical protein